MVTLGVVVLEPYRQRIGDFLVVALVGIARNCEKRAALNPLASQLRAGEVGGVQDFGNGGAYFFKTDLIFVLSFYISFPGLICFVFTKGQPLRGCFYFC